MNAKTYLERDDWLLLAVTIAVATAGYICGSWWAPVVYIPTWVIMAFVVYGRRRERIEEVKQRLLGEGGHEHF